MSIAVIYFGEHIASTVFDHLSSFEKYGSNSYSYYEVSSNELSSSTLARYDVIIVHYTISLFCDSRCPPWLRLLLRSSKAKKIVFLQDEYRKVNDTIENLSYIKADLLYTCVPIEEIENVYPKQKLPNLLKFNTLTGFVPENLLKRKRADYTERKIDVVYRARKLSTWYGRLGREKWQIADKFNCDAKKYNLLTDISYREEDRIYGEEWINFLSNSKAAIGCESGASVFDFSGEIQRKVEKYELENPDATFEDIENKFFKGLDGKIKLNQISPRCFECAALGTLMILYEGEYSKILKPWEHYAPLRKDHSNIDKIVEVINSPEKWNNITSKAFSEVACNSKLSYRFFVEGFENSLRKLFSYKEVNPLKGKGFEESSKNNWVANRSNFQNAGIYLKKLTSFFCGDEFTKSLVKLKARLRMSVLALKQVHRIKKKPLFFYFYIFNVQFCKEVEFVDLLMSYSLLIRQKFDDVCLEADFNLDKKGVTVYISSENKKQISFEPRRAGAKSFKSVNIENSWSMPELVRGRRFCLKYFGIYRL